MGVFWKSNSRIKRVPRLKSKSYPCKPKSLTTLLVPSLSLMPSPIFSPFSFIVTWLYWFSSSRFQLGPVALLEEDPADEAAPAVAERRGAAAPAVAVEPAAARRNNWASTNWTSSWTNTLARNEETALNDGEWNDDLTLFLFRNAHFVSSVLQRPSLSK